MNKEKKKRLFRFFRFYMEIVMRDKITDFIFLIFNVSVNKLPNLRIFNFFSTGNQHYCLEKPNHVNDKSLSHLKYNIQIAKKVLKLP